MTGTITFKKGKHPSRGGWSAPVEIPKEYQNQMEKLLGKSLTQAQLEVLCSGLEMTLHFEKKDERNPTAQDVKETLSAIVRLRDSHEVTEAYLLCDAATLCHLKHALHTMMPVPDAPDAELIRRAAEMALGDIERGRDGRPREFWREYFAIFARRVWREFGRDDDRAWSDLNGDLTDFTQFARLLLNVLHHDKPKGPDAVIKIFGKQKKRPKKRQK